jgi:hypothetical protein
MTCTAGELWISILEKAFAKLYQGYDKLITTHTLDILKAFTPAPSLFLNHDRVSADDIWKHISSNAKGLDAVSSLIFGSNGTETTRMEGHSNGAVLFAVLNAVEVFDPITGKKDRLLKLRDMGEKLDWTGDWSS